jgi:hypothetical protein
MTKEAQITRARERCLNFGILRNKKCASLASFEANYRVLITRVLQMWSCRARFCSSKPAMM